MHFCIFNFLKLFSLELVFKKVNLFKKINCPLFYRIKNILLVIWDVETCEFPFTRTENYLLLSQSNCFFFLTISYVYFPLLYLMQRKKDGCNIIEKKYIILENIYGRFLHKKDQHLANRG